MIEFKRRLPQLFRRATQFSVLFFLIFTAFAGLWRNYRLAHGQQRLVTLMEGPIWGFLYGVYENMLSLFGDPLAISTSFQGFPWSGSILGLDTSDPILAASLMVQGVGLPISLMLGLVVPLGLALVLGKVFCSHLCPARLVFELGERVRAGLIRMGVALPAWRPSARLGGWVLLGGLVATAFSSAAVWFVILPYVSLGAGIHLWVAGGTATALFGVLFFWVAIDIFVAPGLFCRNLCPTGFLLENVGRFSLLRVTKRADAKPCPAGCRVCQHTCPYALLPKEGTPMPSCDACGRCVEACPSDRLQRQFLLPVALLLFMVWVPIPADANHNKGMPHYGYFENYAQVPSEEFLTVQGRWEMAATLFNFQGLNRRAADTPNDVKIYIYLYDNEASHGWEGRVDFTILQDGETITNFVREHVDEESIYSTRETLPRSGEYELVALVDGDRVVLPFHIELAGHGMDWRLMLVLAISVSGIVAIALYGRSQRKRRGTRAHQVHDDA